MKLLLVGNSYLYYHNLQHLLRVFRDGEQGREQAAENANSKSESAKKYNLRILQLSEGGKSLEDFAEDFVAILRGGFDPDVIVLQDFSMGPCLPQMREKSLEVLQKVYVPALRVWAGTTPEDEERRKLDKRNKKKKIPLESSAADLERDSRNRTKRVLFYATHARASFMFADENSKAKAGLVESGDANMNISFSSEREHMEALEAGCMQYVELCRTGNIPNAQLLPIGRVWYEVRQYCQRQRLRTPPAVGAGGRGTSSTKNEGSSSLFHEDGLYHDDGRAHPSPIGSFLTALCIWKALFQCKRVNCDQTLPCLLMPHLSYTYFDAPSREAGEAEQARNKSFPDTTVFTKKGAVLAEVEAAGKKLKSAKPPVQFLEEAKKAADIGVLKDFKFSEASTHVSGGAAVFACLRDLVDRRMLIPTTAASASKQSTPIFHQHDVGQDTAAGTEVLPLLAFDFVAD
ncbi:unnamed protein product [Amoebophrya sp. A120]|nr:unnamed protein product [Amoebophrya sp. A120]|eukprot:GSA120T00002307001.1